MKLTDALRGEHGALKVQFEHLETAVQEAPDLSAVQFLSGLLESALASHAAIEDEVLFPAIAAVIGQGGPLEVMEAEHDEIETTLRNIETCDDLGQARSLMRHALQVAREHFCKEEEVLFPLAENALGSQELEKLGATWSDRRNVQIR